MILRKAATGIAAAGAVFLAVSGVTGAAAAQAVTARPAMPAVACSSPYQYFQDNDGWTAYDGSTQTLAINNVGGASTFCWDFTGGFNQLILQGTNGGKCLTTHVTYLDLTSCVRKPSDLWQWSGGPTNWLYNAYDGKCLTSQGSNYIATTKACNQVADQNWEPHH